MEKQNVYQIRITTKEKDAALAKAKRLGVNLSDVVRDFLKRWVKDGGKTDEKTN